MANKKAGYTGGEDTLYAVIKLAWKLYEDHLARFTTYRSGYTLTIATTALQAGEDAAALPTIQARNGNLKKLRTMLVNASGEAVGMWQDLAGYIDHSFDEDQVSNMRQIAGSRLYGEAANKNWKAGEKMLEMATQFTTKYTQDLTAGGMPATFPVTFDGKKTAFEDAAKNYIEFKTTISKEADTKKAANLAVYNTLMSMLKDAKKIFRKEPEIKKLFSYTALAGLVTKKGKTGFRFTVKQETTNAPGTTTTIVLQPGNIKVYPNTKGIAVVAVKAGAYTYTATTPEFATVVGELTATTGTTHRVNILLQKVVAATAIA